MDSAVAAALVHRAIGDRLTNVFVDTGLLRGNEYQETLELLRKRLGLIVIGVDASDRFLGKLAGVSDPEQKRKIIGNEFISVFVEEQRKLLADAPGLPVKFLVQGHVVSRRHRIRFGERSIGGHQIASQCGRFARRHALRAHRTSARPVQRRGSPNRPGISAAGRNPGETPVSRPGSRSTPTRAHHARKVRNASRRRCGRCGRNPARWPLRKGLAGIRGIAACAKRWSYGRRPDVRAHHRCTRRRLQ